MKLATCSLMLIMVLGGFARAQTGDIPDPLGGFKPYLIGISVPNAEEAAMWYEHNLGFKREGRDTSPSGTTMIVEVRPGIAIELLQPEGSFSIRRFTPDYDPASGQLQGISKIAFAVDDLEAALADLTRKHVRVIRGITELKSFDVKFCLIADNNGNVIQLFQARRSLKSNVH